MTAQADGLILRDRPVEEAVRIVARGAADTPRAGSETLAEQQRGSLGPREFRIADGDGSIRSVTFGARIQTRPNGCRCRLGDRQFGEAGLDGLDMVQSRPMASFAADATIACLGPVPAMAVEVDRPKRSLVAIDTPIERRV